MKARILLKADAAGGGEALSDSQIAAALNTNLATIARTRQQLVEGFGQRSRQLAKRSPCSQPLTCSLIPLRGRQDADHCEGTGEDVYAALGGGDMLVTI
jgi:hypothetical protein